MRDASAGVHRPTSANLVAQSDSTMSHILEAHSPLRRARKGEPDQPISSPFFLSYSGSGELIHLLALSQRTPNLLSVERIVSPETRSFGYALLQTHLCGMLQRPEGGGLAELPGRVAQKLLESFDPLLLESGVGALGS